MTAMDHAQRHQDAVEAIARLYRELGQIIADNKAAPVAISIANSATLELAAEVAGREAVLCDAMESGDEQPGQREALAAARSHLVEARSALDRLNREASERTRRLTDIMADIEGWTARRDQASRALRSNVAAAQ